MKSLLKGNFIYAVVVLISLLLVTNIILTVYNNSIIKRNKALQQEAEAIKIYTEQIGKSTIHGIDIGIRGYTIMQNEQFFSPVDSAILRKDSIMWNVESRLRKQNYDLTEFYAFRDSVNSYVNYALHLKRLLDDNKRDEFMHLFRSDKGLDLWIQYLKCLENISKFEDKINAEAEHEYQSALNRNYILQIVLFLICCPTLIYTAIHTRKRFMLTKQLHELEAEKNKILLEQNQHLETLVLQRTREIGNQKEEIYSQKEELAAQRDTLSEQNKKLSEAYKIIEEQKRAIQNENERLETEVSKRTNQLREMNQELIAHNSQLEQFAFIAAHNLRAPLARILGLANLIEITKNEDDKENARNLIIESSRDLDLVIKDLNTILEIKKHTGIYEKVNIEKIFSRVFKMIERSYKDTAASIECDFSEVKEVFGVGPYVESIFYNLLSNAIKYRHPDRPPQIEMKTRHRGEFICLTIKDNGLGIDLALHHQNMFNLYKRFHLHMEGRGVGLYLVKTQMEALGGRVEVTSKPDEGTTFYLYFLHSQIEAEIMPEKSQLSAS